MELSYRLPAYEDLALALHRLESDASAAEVHGILCGRLCAGPLSPQDWLADMGRHAATADLLAQEALGTLGALRDATLAQLNDPECGFYLLLPEEDDALDDRVEAVGDWCQGFLLGLSMGGVSDFDKLPAEAGEFVTDMVDLSRIGSSYAVEDSDDDAQAVEEIVEYVRVGVLLMNEELAPTREPPTGVNPRLH